MNQKLEKFAVEQLKKNLHNLVLPDEQGNHLIFGRYVMKSHANGCDLYDNNEELVGNFANKRTAMSYCVADKFRKFNLATQIKILDSKKKILTNDIAGRRGLAARSQNQDFKEIVETKLSAKVVQLNTVVNELEKCVNSAKYLQYKGFQNEIARVFTN